MPSSVPRLAVLHHQFGPYHVARARALRRCFPGSVDLIQLARSEALRAWRAEAEDLDIQTAADGVLESLSSSEVSAGVERVLARSKPDVVAIAGYAHGGMRRAAQWARRNGARAILMSDSQERDRVRSRWREIAKRFWVSRHFDAAFVSGALAAFYVERLGIPPHRTWRGYDVVDNNYFALEASAIRLQADQVRERLGLPLHYFLFVGRFAPEKNLFRLVRAFSAVVDDVRMKDWALVLAGSGPLEAELRAQASSLGSSVRFVGFQQISTLPAFYALADALVLPSISEPWGLVVNEAMACGLPVIVSSHCGCVPELVSPGLNGLVVDPMDVSALMTAFLTAADADWRATRAGASKRIIEGYTPETWARVLTDCSLSLLQRAAIGAGHAHPE